MRKPLLSVAVVALATAACSGSAGLGNSGASYAPEPPAHAGHAVTALYAIRLREEVGPQERLATVRVRWTDPDRGGADELSRTVRASELTRPFGEGDAFFRFDSLVAATAETLRGSPWRPDLRLRDLASIADEEADRLPPTDEVHGFLDLLGRLARIER